MNRRDFLKATAAGVALSTFGAHVAGAADVKPIRVGVIGTGWFGKLDTCRLIQVAPVEIVSICDVDKKMAAEAADLFASRHASHRKPRIYGDYRQMLKEKDLDIVVIGTPDHWHPLAMIAAVTAGADVYCQKPISVDVVEGQAMVAAARKYGRVVQVGTQRRSTPHLVEANEKVVKAGLLGKVGYVETCCYWHMRTTENPPDSLPPANLDYEMWTGPAPMRPYNSLVHPRGWRAFMEYGNGIVGDMCIHMYDAARWMLGLGWPKSVSSTGGIYVDKTSRANITDTQSAVFDHGEMQVAWAHRTWGEAPDPRYAWSFIFYGDKGTLKASVDRYEFIPAGKKEPTLHGEPVFELDKYPEDKTEKDLSPDAGPAVRGHMRDFINAIATRGRPVADIEEAHISTASSILANLSMKLGRTLHWDAANGDVIGDPEASALLRRPYRAPWVHPEPGTV
ncbi:MAG: oxidoreductase domain protein [Phycisphaerales bacterium]|jgi:predicted dehydrogenase|nr:oxidoreductase domain protein [Phycisphaerales bacterium]